MGDPSAKGKSASAILQDGTKVGAYEILHRVGVGGMGEVYKARHTGLHKTVALKLLSADVRDDDARARFLREGKLASKIQHPHIVDVTDVGEHEGTPYLVMEFLEGQPMSKLLRKRTRLAPAEAADVMVPVCAAIAAAHAMGVVHRDIKPDNIFLTESQLGETVPKVLDFGISKALEDHTAPAITMTHAFVGTPHYMSPEQAQGAKRATKLSDQYSLGVVLYEAISGVRPFDEPSFLKLVHSIARGRAVPLRHVRPDVDAALEEVIARAMHPEADKRFPSVREMALVLLTHASPRTQALWQPRLETISGPASHFRSVVPDLNGGIPSHSATTDRSMNSGPDVDTFRDAPQSIASAGPITGVGPSVTATPGSDPAGMKINTRDDTFRAAGTRTVSKRGKPWIIIAALALLAAGGLTAIYVAAPPSGTSPTASATTTAPAGETFRISVQVEPSHATLELDGEEVGSGRFVGELPRDGSLHKLVVKAKGYRPQTLGFKDVPPQEKVVLTRLDEPAPTTTATGTSTAVATAPQPTGPWPRPTAATPATAEPTGAPTATQPPPTPTSTSTTGNIDPWKDN